MSDRDAVQRETQQTAGLTSAQMRGLELYAQGLTDAEVASELGVDRSTAWRWRTRDRRFRAQLRKTHAEVTSAAAARLEGLVERALYVLATTLSDQEAPAAIRVRAAEAVLERAGISSDDGARRYAIQEPFFEHELP
jgi:DNA-binding CsgD family transcriptional regulator